MNSRPGGRLAANVGPAVSKLNSILDDIDFNKDSVAVSVDNESKLTEEKIDDMLSRKRKIDPSTCWTKHYDQTKQANFYYNSATGERQWEKPEEFVDVAVSTVIIA